MVDADAGGGFLEAGCGEGSRGRSWVRLQARARVQATMERMDSFDRLDLGGVAIGWAGRPPSPDLGVVRRLLRDGTLLLVRHVGAWVPDRALDLINAEATVCHEIGRVPEFAARLAGTLTRSDGNRESSASLIALRTGGGHWQACLGGCARLWNAGSGELLTPGLTLGEQRAFKGPESFRFIALTIPSWALAQDPQHTWALADEARVVHPTSAGVVSIYAGDWESCATGCAGGWRGPRCSPLPGTVVSLYDRALSPRKRRQVGPFASATTNDDGWADFAGLAQGVYVWAVAFPAGTVWGTVDVRDASPPVDPCTGCLRWTYRYDDDPTGRPDQSWFSVVVDFLPPK